MNSLKGHLLIATRELASPLFARSVILMIDHDEDGAMGVILNRATDATAADLGRALFSDEDVTWEKSVLLGGPVPGPVILLHAQADLADREVVPGVYLTLEADKVREAFARQPDPSRLFVNYSGWGPGQLEGEFEWDSWVTLPATAEDVFADSTGDDLWESVVGRANVRKLGEFLRVKVIPPDPSWN